MLFCNSFLLVFFFISFSLTSVTFSKVMADETNGNSVDFSNKLTTMPRKYLDTKKAIAYCEDKVERENGPMASQHRIAELSDCLYLEIVVNARKMVGKKKATELAQNLKQIMRDSYNVYETLLTGHWHNPGGSGVIVGAENDTCDIMKQFLEVIAEQMNFYTMQNEEDIQKK